MLFCAVRGRLDSAALSKAFDSVVAEHPTLRARIAPDVASSPGYVLEPLDEDERPRLILRTGADDAYLDELNTPLPVGGPLVRAVLAGDPGGQRHSFVLSVDHVITDGHSSITLQNVIWDRYRALVEGGGATRTDPRPWPVPVSDLLPPADPAETAEYLRRRLAETRHHPAELVAYDAEPEAAPADAHRIEVQRLLLDAAHTAELRRLARGLRISVHGLVGSALLTAARARLGGDGPRVLGCLSPVDLRSRLSPPVPPDVMAAAVTTHLHALQVDADADPVALAGELSAHLREAIASGDHFQDMRITPQVPENPALQRGTVIATNMGVVPGPRLPAEAEVTDVRLVPAREHYFPQAGRSPLMACVVSFNGRLSVELPHHTACFTAAFMRGFRDDVHSALLSFATSHDEPPTAGITA